MDRRRTVRKIVHAKPTIEGAGVHLKRVFGFHQAPEFDPFLLLDDFRSDDLRKYRSGFPWHPHRGIETITYVLRGRVAHGDSLGNQGVIAGGDVQWMTAGSGIIHQEMPDGDDSGMLSGFQLWANLPASQKMAPPRYREIKRDQIPEVLTESGCRVRVIAGEFEDAAGPVSDVVINPEYLDVSMPPQAEFRFQTPVDRTILAYVIEGNGNFSGGEDPYEFEVEGSNYFDMRREALVGDTGLVHFTDGEYLLASAGAAGMRFLLLSGNPLGEPVAWHGPIVMNTQKELQTAFEEYRQGTFLKH
jgi:redox-sensitive bicupin YhaK (pirin superfamily)